MLLPFKKTKSLESQMDKFLDIVVKGTLAMKLGLVSYLQADLEEFEARIHMVATLENQADDIRKQVETTLYSHSLIPESRGDVLGLLEHMDNVIDSAKAVLRRFEVEQPQIPQEYHEAFVELADHSAQAVDHVVAASRAYFREVHAVRDHINKVDFYESEADRVALKLKKQIFRSELDLARKMHLRYFASQLEGISDTAEHVAERLAIAAIKRSI